MNVDKIIVRMPNWLGDIVMALPILADLRIKFPDATIDVLVRGAGAELLKENPHINHIFSFKKKEEKKVIRKLKKNNYTIGLLLTNSLSSAWIFWRAKIKHVIGFKGNFRRFFLTTALDFPSNKEKQHLVITYKSLLQPLNIGISTTAPELYVNEEEMNWALHFLRDQGIQEGATIFGINPGAAYGSAKCWLPERFEKVALNLLENPNHWVLFFGDKQGSFLIDEICAKLPSRALNLAGKTNLRELMALMKHCRILLTNDSGPMHMAAALKIPLLALFGSTNEVATGPYNCGKVIHKHVSCSPCYKRICPTDFRCMKQITEDEVTETLLSSSP